MMNIHLCEKLITDKSKLEKIENYIQKIRDAKRLLKMVSNYYYCSLPPIVGRRIIYLKQNKVS
jgi:hypothetical protein